MVGRPLSNNTSEVGLIIGAFDAVDALHEFKLRLETILNLLSVWTNCSFDENSPDPTANALDNAVADFWTDTDWIDEHPVTGDRLCLERECVGFGDEVVSGRIDSNHPLLRAMRLFHQGLSVANNDHNMGDLTAVLLISALECISEGEPATCAECGQPVYKISQRVVDLGRRHLGDSAALLFRRHYALRSRYLHLGRMLGVQPMTGQSIPQLDPDSPEGCAMPVWISRPHNLIEFVSFVIRGEIRNYVLKNAPSEAS